MKIGGPAASIRMIETSTGNSDPSARIAGSSIRLFRTGPSPVAR